MTDKLAGFRILFAAAVICLPAAAPAVAAAGIGMTGAIKSQGEELDKKVAAAEAISKDETVSLFSAPTGTVQLVTDVGATYSTAGGTSSLGHALEYRFLWGDGTDSDWRDYLAAKNYWSRSGGYNVQVQARCVQHKNAFTGSPVLGINVLSGIRTIAGTGMMGNYGDGLPATSATLGMIMGLAMDSAGNIYISDFINNRIRRIDGQTGYITAFAGTGVAGYSGDGGPALNAKLKYPSGLAIDASDNLYITDYGNYVIRKVDAVTGFISTVAGCNISGFSGDGGPATLAKLKGPMAISIGPNGHLYIADYMGARIRKVNAYTGIINTIAGTGTAGYNGDGIPATTAQISNAYDLLVNWAGDVYIADTFNHRVRRIDRDSGIIFTVAGNGISSYNGDGIPATSAQINQPWGIFTDRKRYIYVATIGSRIRRIDTATGLIATMAGDGTDSYNGDNIAAVSAWVYMPRQGAVGAQGELIFADFFNYRIRRIAP